MTSVVNQLEAVYTGLCNVLHNPETFDFGYGLPPRLVSSLEVDLATLAQAIEELKMATTNDDLAAELSEDADRATPVG